MQSLVVEQQAAAPALSRATEQEEVIVAAEEPISLAHETAMPEQPLPDQALGFDEASTAPAGALPHSQNLQQTQLKCLNRMRLVMNRPGKCYAACMHVRKKVKSASSPAHVRMKGCATVYAL